MEFCKVGLKRHKHFYAHCKLIRKLVTFYYCKLRKHSILLLWSPWYFFAIFVTSSRACIQCFLNEWPAQCLVQSVIIDNGLNIVCVVRWNAWRVIKMPKKQDSPQGKLAKLSKRGPSTCDERYGHCSLSWNVNYSCLPNWARVGIN